MKAIKYKIMTEENRGTDEKPVIEQVFQNAVITCTSEENLTKNIEIAKAEAYKGEYTVEDVGETYV